jgi:chemotaxis methyl-accepting protein methylase
MTATPNPEAYYRLLASDTTASRVVEELVLPLTVGESYFFRDSGSRCLAAVVLDCRT